MVDEISIGRVEQNNLAFLLIRAMEWFDDALIGQMRATGCPMSRPHSMVFGHLEPGGSRSVDLARRIGVSRQAIHKTLKEMEEFGWVRLVPDPTDQRAKLVMLTRQGKQHVADARRILFGIECELIQRIGEERVTALRDALMAGWGAPPVGEHAPCSDR